MYPSLSIHKLINNRSNWHFNIDSASKPWVPTPFPSNPVESGTEVGPGLAVWVPKLWNKTSTAKAVELQSGSKMFQDDPSCFLRPPHLSEFDDFSGTDGKPLDSLCNIRHGVAEWHGESL